MSNDDFIFSGAYPHPRYAQGGSDVAVNCCILMSGAHTLCGAVSTCRRVHAVPEAAVRAAHGPRARNHALWKAAQRDLRVRTVLCLLPVVCTTNLRMQWPRSFAEKKLNTIKLGGAPLQTIYGIGDNPHSDIHGANQAGAHWTSILVRTGVFQDADGLPEHEPDVYADAVLDAVRHIYATESIDPSVL